MPRIRQQRLLIRKSNRPKRTGGKHDRRLARVGGQIANENLRAVVAEQFVEGVNEIALTIQIKAQETQLHVSKIGIRQTAELHTQRSYSVRRLDRGPQAVRRQPLGLRDCEWPEGCVVARPELAGVAFNR